MERPFVDIGNDRRSRCHPFEVSVMHACAGPPAAGIPVPVGHQLTRVRLRCLLRSERLIVSSGTACLGVAAYQVVDSDVRVVHEFLVDPHLDQPDRAAVIDALLGAIEFTARADGVRSMTILLRPRLPLDRFCAHGYVALLADAAGAWLQKKLKPSDWSTSCSLLVQ